MKGSAVPHFVDNCPLRVTHIGGHGGAVLHTEYENPRGRIDFNCRQTGFSIHRSGWNYALSGLAKYHRSGGVMFDGFLENAFCWQAAAGRSSGLPYQKPWIGVLHNPPNMPPWFSDNNATPTALLYDKMFRQSLRTCRGLYTLSKYHADYLRLHLPDTIKINVLYHPTEIPEHQFLFERFVANPRKRLVSIGWWLRRIWSLYALQCPYEKTRLMPGAKLQELSYAAQRVEEVIAGFTPTQEQRLSVTPLQHLDNDEYDRLLCENIVFLDLYDSSANNAVIECIARCTPMLINRLPAVREYLGDEYPLYFSTYDEAEEKLKNTDLIRRAAEYLREFPQRSQIFLTTFARDFYESAIYQSLPCPV